MELTVQTVDALQPTERTTIYWDDELPHFGLRIWPSGVKSYLLQYSNRQGKQRQLTLGRHVKFTAEQARERARLCLQRVRYGSNPTAPHREDRKALTVKDLCQEYLALCETGAVLGSFGRPMKSYISKLGRIEHHIIRLLGDKFAHDVTTADVKVFMDNVAKGKAVPAIKASRKHVSAFTGGGKDTARCTASLLASIFSLAFEQGHITQNPVMAILRASDNRHETRLTADQYRAFGKAVEAAERDGEHWQSVAIARLLALTGCNLGEITNLRKAEVDLNGRCLLPSDKRIRRGVIPLGSPSLAILAACLERSNGASPFVFSGLQEPTNAFDDFPNAWRRIVGTRLAPHDLRHGFRSTCIDLAVRKLAIMAVVGHCDAPKSRIGRSYVHKVDPVLGGEVDRVTRFILRAMAGRSS